MKRPLIVALSLGIFALPALSALKSGEKAPDFAAKAALSGKAFDFSLRDALKKGPVVVYFYPSAYTGGCNLQAHEFAVNKEKFDEAGALTDQALRRLRERAAARGLATLVEVHERDELSRALDAGADVIGVNSRNLRTLTVDLAVLDDLVARMPPHVTAIAESGIRSADDITRLTAAGYHAFLVGERLITQRDPGAALRELRSPREEARA